jgi:diguanylate cyclase (GGDEF)-like protein
MSFRTRLTGFFVLIVVVPMIAVAVLVFRLISDSQNGKADARAGGLASAANSLYDSESASGRADAETIARQLAASGPALLPSLDAIAAHSGLARVTVRAGSKLLADAGGRTAIAPGSARLPATSSVGAVTVTASEVTAAQYARDLRSPGVQVVVRVGGSTLGTTLPAQASHRLPSRGTVTIGGTGYRTVTGSFPWFGARLVDVTVLSSLAATDSSTGTSELVAGGFVAGFLVLAFAFSILAARELEGQLGRFLHAARRLGSGDFSSRVPVEGHDEFAALGEEFNKMSSQLESRLDELQQERARLRESIRRIGQTFASNLDRPALLELALRTAVDAVNADFARLSVRSTSLEPLAQTGVVGSLDGFGACVHQAENAALSTADIGEARGSDRAEVVSVALGRITPGGRVYGLIAVGRRRRQFADGDRDVLRSLAAQATLALENVELHHQVQRQAVTDELTGLANHGQFQELLDSEMEQVRRYRYPVGLIMLDLDDFKSINDTHGHPQGDVVLQHVARVLRETSREVDIPARYGGEEMAVILPHTNLAAARAIAERARSAIQALTVPMRSGECVLRITASFGVASSAEGDKDALISGADAALYAAKRSGKNRTETNPPQPTKSRLPSRLLSHGSS